MTDNLPTNLKDRVKRLETLFTDHIGSSGVDIHEPASRWATGFARPQNVTRAELKNADGSSVDITKAPDGHWFSFNILNGPEATQTAGFYLIDIFTSIGGRRDMTVTISADGRSWFRTIHSDAQGGSGWVQTQGRAFQFTGNVDNFNQTGITGTMYLQSISRGIDGFDVSLIIRLDNVTAIAQNNAVMIYRFTEASKPYLKPPFNFQLTIEDFNKVDLTESTKGKLNISGDGIALTRPANATGGTSLRGSFYWHVPL